MLPQRQVLSQLRRNLRRMYRPSRFVGKNT
jgi:hypothetical protein